MLSHLLKRLRPLDPRSSILDPKIILLRRDPDEDLSEKELARVFRHGREARAESWRAIRQVIYDSLAECAFDLTDASLTDKQHHFAQGGLSNLTALLDRLDTLAAPLTQQEEDQP